MNQITNLLWVSFGLVTEKHAQVLKCFQRIVADLQEGGTFSVVPACSLRLGSKLPPGVSQPPQFAKRPWETQPQARGMPQPPAWSQHHSQSAVSRPLNHIPHIRNPKLRQYYLQGTPAAFHRGQIGSMLFWSGVWIPACKWVNELTFCHKMAQWATSLSLSGTSWDPNNAAAKHEHMGGASDDSRGVSVSHCCFRLRCISRAVGRSQLCNEVGEGKLAGHKWTENRCMDACLHRQVWHGRVRRRRLVSHVNAWKSVITTSKVQDRGCQSWKTPWVSRVFFTASTTNTAEGTLTVRHTPRYFPALSLSLLGKIAMSLSH